MITITIITAIGDFITTTTIMATGAPAFAITTIITIITTITDTKAAVLRLGESVVPLSPLLHSTFVGLAFGGAKNVSVGAVEDRVR